MLKLWTINFKRTLRSMGTGREWALDTAFISFIFIVILLALAAS